MVSAAMTNFDEQIKSEHMDMSSHLESSMDHDHQVLLLDQSNDVGMLPNK